MKSAMERGLWVFFQNCHLAPSWMPALERLIEQIDADKVFSRMLTDKNMRCELLLVSDAFYVW
jgi:hypothetical protein